ncbi:hypothetical protein VitviT2T_020759 [Vitis vinifera]|uniref:Agamous-like MADS-box protein AGL80 n=2 Tax=Vitis vinifera TaxID=29760 RepID=A0A438D0C0_VITVI|eukprot:XP_002279507.1 PREDICTED: agamous-like MADS-box protein AGL80 [Vitis vinifera]
MTRKKVKLAYITNDSARKATFKKRKKGLMKKVSELSTLCGIDACAILYSPYDSQPEVWPSPLGVQRVLAHFKKMPEMEQSKKMVNQESFLRQRIAKGNEQLKKQRKDNREKEITQVMYQSLTGKGLQNLNIVDLNDLGWMIDQNLKDIHKRIESLNKEAQSQAAAAAAAAAGQLIKTGGKAQEEKPAFDSMDAIQRQQWFVDLVNPNEQMGFAGDDMMLPFGDNNHNALWPNGFFP